MTAALEQATSAAEAQWKTMYEAVSTQLEAERRLRAGQVTGRKASKVTDSN